MKKLFAMLLAVVMIFSLSTVAFAEEVVETPTGLVSEVDTYTAVIKAYNVVGATNSTLYPAETLYFEVSAAPSNPDTPVIEVAPLTVTGNSDQHLTITLPVYDEVGTYTYTITEKEGATQGVIYTTDSIDVTVYVTFNYVESKLDTQVVLSTPSTDDTDEDGKVDTFTNTYEVGSLTVSKVVTGNLGNKNKDFNVTVEFTATEAVLSTITYTGGTIAPDAWTDGKASVVITLAHGESVTFDNIPAGVTYTVVEDDYTGGELNGENGYDAPEYNFSDTAKAISASDDDTVEITNNKNTDVDTGIVLDSMPYVVILAVACFGMFAVLTKKRYEV